MSNQDFRVRLLYGNLRVEIINHFNEYIHREGHSLDQLKDRFGECLSEELKERVQDVEDLISALEEEGVIGENNVENIRLLAERIGLEALVERIEEYEYDCSGFIRQIFTRVAGAVRSSAIHLWAVLLHGGVQAIELAAAALRVFGMDPETVQNIQPFLDLGAQVLAFRQGSVVFVLKVSSIASIKRLWKGYKDGSLKKSMKKDLNEMKELKELSKGEEIDVELTIDEDEYREVYWNLIISEMKVMHDKVERTDSGASTSLQAEKERKQSDLSTQVPHSDQMTYDEKLSDADVRKAGEKLEKESFTQSVVAMRDKERMSKAQQLLLKECFSLFKDDIIPTELLENLPCLTNEQKDQIAYDEKNQDFPSNEQKRQIAYDEKNQDFPSKAVETLVEKLKEHKEGFEQFVEALRKADLGHVAALLDANYVGIPIIVRIRGQMKSLEREIASKFSNSFSKEAKKLRRDFEKFRMSELGYMQKEHRSLFDMIPRGIYFVRTKLMEDVSAKGEGTKTTGAQDVPQITEGSLAVIFRLNKINLLDKLWQMYENRELEEVFRSVLWNELSSSAVDLFFRKEDYDECKRTLKEVNWKTFIEENPAAFENFIGTLDRGSATYVFTKCSVLADRLGAPSPIKEKCKSSSMKKQSPTLALLEFPKVCGNLSVNGLVEKLMIMDSYDVIYTIESGIPDYQEYPLKNALRDHKEVFQQVARQLDERGAYDWRSLGLKLEIECDELNQIALGCNPAKQLLEDYAYPTLEPEKLTVGCFRQHIKTMDRDDILRRLDEFGITQQNDARSIKDVIPSGSERMWKMSVLLNQHSLQGKDWRSLAQLWGIKHEVYSQFNPLQENPFKILLQDWLTVERPEFTVNDLCAILEELQMNDANRRLELLLDES